MKKILTRKDKIINITCWVFIVFGIIVIAVYYIMDEHTTCVSDPIGYAIKDIKSNTNVENISGTMSLIINNVPVKIIYFGDREGKFPNREDINSLENITGLKLKR